jgi:hypothetical protein
LCSKAFYQMGQINSTTFGRHCKEHLTVYLIRKKRTFRNVSDMHGHYPQTLQKSVSPPPFCCTPWPFSARQESRISKPCHLYCWSRHFTEFYSPYQRIVELCRAFSLFSLLHGVNQESYLLIFSYNYDNTKNQKYVCFHQTGVFKGQRTAICMFLYRYAYYLFAVIKYL